MSDYYRDSAGPLFDLLARPSDPPTSHEAASRSRSFASGHRLLILQALEVGPAGQTELARRTGLTVAAVSRRLNELVRGGQIVRDGEARSASGGREAAYMIKLASR